MNPALYVSFIAEISTQLVSELVFQFLQMLEKI